MISKTIGYNGVHNIFRHTQMVYPARNLHLSGIFHGFSIHFPLFTYGYPSLALIFFNTSVIVFFSLAPWHAASTWMKKLDVPMLGFLRVFFMLEGEISDDIMYLYIYVYIYMYIDIYIYIMYIYICVFICMRFK